MVLNDVKIFYAQGDLTGATFSKTKVLNKVAEYGYPEESADEVERTYFNTDHVKNFDYGYSDMGEATIKLDLDIDNMAALEELRGYKESRATVCFGIIVDAENTGLNKKFAGKIKSLPIIDGTVTPGANVTVTIKIHVISKLAAFTEPSE